MLGFAGKQSEGDSGDRGLYSHKLPVSGQIVHGVSLEVDEKVLRPEFYGRVEFVLADSTPLEKNYVEGIGEPILGHAVIKPDDGGIDFRVIFKPFNRIRRTQGDVDLSSRCPPARPRRFPAECLVGIADAAVVLFFEFIFRFIGIGVSLFPEGLDEHPPFSIGLKLQEDIFFLGSDYVDDLFLQPGTVFCRQVFGRFFLSIPEHGKQENYSKEQSNYMSFQWFSFQTL